VTKVKVLKVLPRELSKAQPLPEEEEEVEEEEQRPLEEL
jgi:hypothetical protein